MKKELSAINLRYLAYRSFINIISSADFDRKIRYILPSCVVTAVRNQFPNPEDVPYKGYIEIETSDILTLP